MIRGTLSLLSCIIRLLSCWSTFTSQNRTGGHLCARADKRGFSFALSDWTLSLYNCLILGKLFFCPHQGWAILAQGDNLLQKLNLVYDILYTQAYGLSISQWLLHLSFLIPGHTHYRHMDIPPFIKIVIGEIFGNYLLSLFPGTEPSMHVCSVEKLYPTLCNPMDCSPPGSSVHGIFQARMLE